MRERLRFASSPERHHQGINYQLAGHRALHRPVDDPSGVKIRHHGNVQPALGRPDVSEISHPLLVRDISYKLSIQQIGFDRPWQGLTTADGLSSTLGPCPQGLGFHQPLNLMQTIAMAFLKHILQNAARTIGTGAGHKALIHMSADYFIKLRLIALGPSDPSIKPASRATKAPHTTTQPARPLWSLAMKPNLTSTPWQRRLRLFLGCQAPFSVTKCLCGQVQ